MLTKNIGLFLTLLLVVFSVLMLAAPSNAANRDCVSCHDTGAPNQSVDISAMNKTNSTHNLLNNGSFGLTLNPDNERCWACHGDGNGTEIAQPIAAHPVNYTTPKSCTDCHNTSLFSAILVKEHNSNGTDIQTTDDCLGCHIKNLVSYSDPDGIGNISSNTSHYSQKLSLGGTDYCIGCHINNTDTWNSTQIRHPAKSQSDSFCTNCHNSNPASSLHDTVLKKDRSIHFGFDWEGDDAGEGGVIPGDEGCMACHEFGMPLLNPTTRAETNTCEDCHLNDSRGPYASRPDINSTMPIVYQHITNASSIRVSNQSASVTGIQDIQSSCFGFDASTGEGTCHAVAYANRGSAGDMFAIIDNYTIETFSLTRPYDEMDPYVSSGTIDTMPNTTQCLWCHGSTDADLRTAWGDPSYKNSTHFSATDNASCWNCHTSTGLKPSDFHSNELIIPPCKDCHFGLVTMQGYSAQEYYVNSGMYNNSVHGSLECENCHTKRHNSRDGLKSCESCHVEQDDYINDKDRHNIIRSPDRTVGGESVVTTGNCALCHDSALLSAATSNFNATATNDCDYCHTYPDKNRETFY